MGTEVHTDCSGGAEGTGSQACNKHLWWGLVGDWECKDIAKLLPSSSMHHRKGERHRGPQHMKQRQQTWGKILKATNFYNCSTSFLITWLAYSMKGQAQHQCVLLLRNSVIIVLITFCIKAPPSQNWHVHFQDSLSLMIKTVLLLHKLAWRTKEINILSSCYLG
jgi:hypothetical protein